MLNRNTNCDDDDDDDDNDDENDDNNHNNKMQSETCDYTVNTKYSLLGCHFTVVFI